jgi:hypothetical protein
MSFPLLSVEKKKPLIFMYILLRSWEEGLGDAVPEKKFKFF